MKTKLLFMALFLLLTNAAFSNPVAATLSVTRKDSSSVYLVNYTDGSPGKVTLVVKDDRGNVLFRQLVQNEKGFVLPVNFSSVAEGVYTVHTDNGTEKQNVTIRYNNNTAPTYSRIVSLGDNRYLLISTHAGKETINIKIYDGNNTLIFSEDRKIEGFFSTIFNLKSVTGMPTFEVSETLGRSLMVPGNPIISIVGKVKTEQK